MLQTDCARDSAWLACFASPVAHSVAAAEPPAWPSMLNTHQSDFKNTPVQPHTGMPGLTAPLNFLYILCYK